MNSGWSVAGGWTAFGLAVMGGAVAGHYRYKEKHDVMVEDDRLNVIARKIRLEKMVSGLREERLKKGRIVGELDDTTSNLVRRISGKEGVGKTVDVPKASIAFEGSYGGVQARASAAALRGQDTHAVIQRRLTKTNR